jgi:hypothetical protein
VSKNPLFSTYKQGENRVTSSMLAVFERIDVSLLEQLLAAATGETSFQMVSFTNQPAGVGDSVPDALIQARFAYWFEVKTALNALRYKQLDEHLKSLDTGATDQRLFVVTPDPGEPSVIAELGDARVVWFNFSSLSTAIDALLTDSALLPGERTVFLLRELQALFKENGLLDADDTVIVAARFAYPEYLEHGVYICQPGRRFRQGLTHLGFYFKGAIQRELSAILAIYDDIGFTEVEATRLDASTDPIELRVADAIRASLTTGRREEGNHEVFILSRADDDRTLKLAQPIVNATTDYEGKPFAWTMNQRYTSIAALRKPGTTTTVDLETAT